MPPFAGYRDMKRAPRALLQYLDLVAELMPEAMEIRKRAGMTGTETDRGRPGGCCTRRTRTRRG